MVFNDFCTENCSSQRQNLALTGSFFFSSLGIGMSDHNVHSQDYEEQFGTAIGSFASVFYRRKGPSVSTEEKVSLVETVTLPRISGDDRTP